MVLAGASSLARDVNFDPRSSQGHALCHHTHVSQSCNTYIYGTGHISGEGMRERDAYQSGSHSSTCPGLLFFAGKSGVSNSVETQGNGRDWLRLPITS